MNQPAPQTLSHRSPIVEYWHLHTDASGVSRHQLSTLTNFALGGIGAAAPQWNNFQDSRPSTVVFVVLPPLWVGEWHENPAPQWIVPLSGRWWVEAMDGSRVEMGPGELSFGEDQNCIADTDGHRGHRSGTVGDTAVVLMTVRLDTLRAPAP